MRATFAGLVFTSFTLLLKVSQAAPELPRAEQPSSERSFPRLDVNVHGGPLYPTRSDIDFESYGAQLALEPVVRLNPYFGLGVSAQYARVVYSSKDTGAAAGDVYLTQAALIARYTPLGDFDWMPYVQLGVGAGEYSGIPQCVFCSVDDQVLLSAVVGLEYELLPRFRVGLSLATLLFGLGVSEAGVALPPGGPPIPQSPPWPGISVAPRLSVTAVWDPARNEDNGSTAGASTDVQVDRTNAPQPHYPRLDLSLHAGPLYPTRSDASTDSFGLQFAIEPVLRLNPYFGVGLSVQYAQLSFTSSGTEDLPRGAEAGEVHQTQAAIVGRTTPLGDSDWVPYAQLGVGLGEYVSVPECSCSIDDTIMLSAAAGLEYQLLSGLRLGLSATTFWFGLSRRVQFNPDEAELAALRGPAPPWPKAGVAPRLSVTSVWE